MGESLYLALQGFIILPAMKSNIVLALYILDVTLCLIQIKKNRPYAYMATKPLLMPLLCAVYYAFLPEHLAALPHQRMRLPCAAALYDLPFFGRPETGYQRFKLPAHIFAGAP